jgi:hypothetical protein
VLINYQMLWKAKWNHLDFMESFGFYVMSNLLTWCNKVINRLMSLSMLSLPLFVSITLLYLLHT